VKFAPYITTRLKTLFTQTLSHTQALSPFEKGVQCCVSVCVLRGRGLNGGIFPRLYNTVWYRRHRKTVGLKSLFPGPHLTMIYIHLLEAVSRRKCSSCTVNYKPITTLIHLMEEVFSHPRSRLSTFHFSAECVLLVHHHNWFHPINHILLYYYLLPVLCCLLNEWTLRASPHV